MIALVPLGKASMDLYPEFVASVEEIAGLESAIVPRVPWKSSPRGRRARNEHSHRFAPWIGTASGTN